MISGKDIQHRIPLISSVMQTIWVSNGYEDVCPFMPPMASDFKQVLVDTLANHLEREHNLRKTLLKGSRCL